MSVEIVAVEIVAKYGKNGTLKDHRWKRYNIQEDILIANSVIKIKDNLKTKESIYYCMDNLY